MTTEQDTLDLATRATRSIDEPSPDRAAAVRRAVLEATSQRQGRSAPIARKPQRKAVVSAVLLAAALGGTAFAAVATQARVRARSLVATSAPPLPAPAQRAPVAAASAIAPTRTPVEPAVRAQPTPVLAQSASPQPAPRAPSPVVATRSARTVTIDARAQSPSPTSESARSSALSTAPSTVAPRADSLYHDAHEAHFVARDAALALARWNAYLAAEPAGRFVPEAQFNRIVCLVRLGRTQEALAAVRELPATHYRHAEAERLREHLEAR